MSDQHLDELRRQLPADFTRLFASAAHLVLLIDSPGMTIDLLRKSIQAERRNIEEYGRRVLTAVCVDSSTDARERIIHLLSDETAAAKQGDA